MGNAESREITDGSYQHNGYPNGQTMDVSEVRGNGETAFSNNVVVHVNKCCFCTMHHVSLHIHLTNHVSTTCGVNDAKTGKRADCITSSYGSRP